MKLLESQSYKPLTMVIAPAGYGKSVLVSQWLEEYPRQHIWLSLDNQMNTETEFLKYLVAGLRRQFPNHFKNLETYEQQVHMLQTEKISEIIINELSRLDENLVIVCDDFHLISNQQLKKTINFLISNTLSFTQWVLITRSEFSFRLDEPYLFDKLTEIRFSELAFSVDELGLLLNNREFNEFDNTHLNELIERTEGWILGLLMILKHAGADLNVHEALNASATEEAFIELSDQLFEQLPEEVATLIPVVALCEYFDEELINQLINVLEMKGVTGKSFINALKQHNFFYVKLTGKGNFYRIHHSFQDLLRSRLKDEQPDIYNKAILRINEWYLINGHIDEAIKYAVYFDNYELAIQIIEEHRFQVIDEDQWWRLKDWIEVFPENVRNSDSVLLLARLWVLENTVQLGDFRPILAVLEKNLHNYPHQERSSEYHLHLAWFNLFVESDIPEAKRNLEVSKGLMAGSRMLFARRELYLAMTRQMMGNYEEALRELVVVQDNMREDQLMSLRVDLAKSWIMLINGNLEEAELVAENFLFKARTEEFKSILAYSLYFRGNVAFQMAKGIEDCKSLEESTYYEKEHNYRIYVDAYAGMCLCRSLHGQPGMAMASWQKLSDKLSLLGYTWFQDHINSIKSRLLWHQGKAAADLEWALSDWSTPNHTELMFALDFPGFTKIRLVCTYGHRRQIKQSLKYLDNIEKVLEENNNNYHLLDTLLIRCLGYFRLGDKNRAEELLAEAFVLGEQTKIARPFIEIGMVVPELREPILSSPVNSLLPNEVWLNVKAETTSLNGLTNHEHSYQLLSMREKELVKLVMLGLRNKEIADQLNISEVTVKSHLTNIFKKLGVRNRSRLIHLLSSYDLSN